MSKMTSNKPYLMRATIEWIVDNECTPHLVVNTLLDGVLVPEGFSKDGQITLNISASAVRDFQVTNEAVSFSAKFNGVPCDLYVPCYAVMGVVAQENGQGIFFEIEEPEDVPPPKPPKGKPGLKLVK